MNSVNKIEALTETIMEAEAKQASLVIAEQLKVNQQVAMRIGKRLSDFSPNMVMIVGRGSSDHAGVFGKYLLEIEVGIPTFSAAPSVSSVYGKKLTLNKAVVIVISQSGRSPDILAQAEMAMGANAYCIALVNDENSPLAQIADDVLPLKAGEEVSVAATKSYLSTLSALLQLTAYWAKNKSLIKALDTLPSAMQHVVDSEIQLTAALLATVKNMVVLGRGLGFAIAKEMALKLKEVSSIHAEAFSSAEFLHGPVTLVEQGLVILDSHVCDETAKTHTDQIKEVISRGADVISMRQVVDDIHPRLAPLLILQRFYLDVAAVAVARGFNPDEPKGLKKVTQTR